MITKKDIVKENMHKIDENAHQVHKNELSIEKISNFVDRHKSEFSHVEEEILDLEKKTTRNTRILLMLVIILVTLFSIIYLNGRSIYQETGIDESQNNVLTEE